MLYYIPAVMRPHADKIREAGIAYAFDSLGKTVIGHEVLQGPLDGPGGIILADKSTYDTDRVGYYPDRQIWRKVPGAKSQTEHGHVCVGYYRPDTYRDLAPTPERLARKTQLPGHLVELADGTLWQCPAALQVLPTDPPRVESTLPRGIDIDDDGNWITVDLLPDFAHLWEICERWQSFYASQSGSSEIDAEIVTELELVDVFDDAAACLAANYRLSKVEIGMLGLFSDATAARVLNALIDLPGLMEISQKKTVD